MLKLKLKPEFGRELSSIELQTRQLSKLPIRLQGVNGWEVDERSMIGYEEETSTN